MTSIFIAKESRSGEHRVAATPETTARYIKLGFSVIVEQGAGNGACFSDEQYQDAGASISSDFASGCAATNLVLKVAPATSDEAQHLTSAHVVVSFLQLDLHGDDANAVLAKDAKIFAMEKVPRTTLAQKMDALSSQANIAGYKAVLIGACELGKYFQLLMTAAGTVKPARVVIFGVGVAGLQAIATAKRLGAVVEATDIRPEVKEQVESLGGHRKSGVIPLTRKAFPIGETPYWQLARSPFPRMHQRRVLVRSVAIEARTSFSQQDTSALDSSRVLANAEVRRHNDPVTCP